jgi:hypothetical protein
LAQYTVYIWDRRRERMSLSDAAIIIIIGDDCPAQRSRGVP